MLGRSSSAWAMEHVGESVANHSAARIANFIIVLVFLLTSSPLFYFDVSWTTFFPSQSSELSSHRIRPESAFPQALCASVRAFEHTQDCLLGW